MPHQETPPFADQDPPKEYLQRIAKHETKAELVDLTAEVSNARLLMSYARNQDYFGFVADGSFTKPQVLTALQALSHDSIGNVMDHSPLVIKNLLTEYLALQDDEAADHNFSQIFKRLKNKSITNHEYLDRVFALADSDPTAVPQTYLASYRQYQQLLSPSVVTNETDRKTIEQKFTGLDMTTPTQPDPIAFIQTEILGDPEQTGISLETQNQIRETFNIPKVNSGTEIQHVLGATNDDGSVVYDQINPLPIRPGVNAYVDHSGSQILQTEIAGRASRDFDITGWSASRVTELTEYLTLYTLSEQAGISNMLEACYDIEFALGDDFDLDKQAQTRQVIEALLGRDKGYDGRIIDESDIAMLKWQLQIFSNHGDKAQGDHDIETTRQNLIELGVRDENGQLNYEVLKAVGSYTREIYLTGEPSYGSLNKHLKQIFR